MQRNPRDGADVEGGEAEPMLGGTRESFDSLSETRVNPSDTEEPAAKKPKYQSNGPLKAIAALWGVCLIVFLGFVFLNIMGYDPSSSPSSAQETQGAQNGNGNGNGNGKPHTSSEPQQGSSVTSSIPSSVAHIVSSSTQASLPVLSATPAASFSGAQVANLSVAEQLDLETGFVISKEPTLREYVFNITREDYAPDGNLKSMILVNGQFPGPLIEANSGDTIRVHVNNMMPNASTTIHWHGIDQRNTTWMDGVQGTSQCGIPPGESFTYEFTITNQRGTFWYHSHVSVQYVDGLYGPLIIHDPSELVPAVDDEKILMIGDLHYEDGEMLLSEYLGVDPSWSSGMSGLEPPPDNFLMNGRHVSQCSVESDTEDDGGMDGMDGMDGMEGMDMGGGGMKRGSSSTRDVHKSCAAGSRWTTRIENHARLRLRLISSSANAPYYFSIDNHTLEIVEMDGVEIEPIKTTRVFMNPGQRYSVIVKALQTPGNYLMRAVVATRCFHLPGHMHSMDNTELNIAKVDYQATGILSYDDTDIEAEPLGIPWDRKVKSHPGVGKEPWKGKCHDLPFDLAKPIRVEEAYEVGDGNHHYTKYRMGMVKGKWRTHVNKDEATLWKMAQKNTTSPSTALPGGLQWDFGEDQKVLVSHDPAGAQIVINSLHMMSHPWHLHGQNFQIVGWGKGFFGKEETTWNLDNPTRRDSFTMPGDSHVVLRIRADNPGIWALHCHILWHSEGGMFLSIAQRLDELQNMISTGDGKAFKERFCLASPTRPTLPVESG